MSPFTMLPLVSSADPMPVDFSRVDPLVSCTVEPGWIQQSAVRPGPTHIFGRQIRISGNYAIMELAVDIEAARQEISALQDASARRFLDLEALLPSNQALST